MASLGISSCDDGSSRLGDDLVSASLQDPLALYTVAYPSSEKYMGSWCESVVSQTDKNFDVWISVYGLDLDLVKAKMGGLKNIHWLAMTDNLPLHKIWETAISKMIDAHSAVILADIDDFLLPARVEHARASLVHSDASACAMNIMNGEGQDLGLLFAPPAGTNLDEFLPRNNVFGFSNVIYKSEVLRHCMPLPEKCILGDWYLATKAWGAGFRLDFDFNAGVSYRQYSSNTAKVLPPFTAEQVIKATHLVLDHYEFMMNYIHEFPLEKQHAVKNAAVDVTAFYNAMNTSADLLERYVQEFNNLPPAYIWWACVDNPQLRRGWQGV